MDLVSTKMTNTPNRRLIAFLKMILSLQTQRKADITWRLKTPERCRNVNRRMIIGKITRRLESHRSLTILKRWINWRRLQEILIRGITRPWLNPPLT